MTNQHSAHIANCSALASVTGCLGEPCLIRGLLIIATAIALSFHCEMTQLGAGAPEEKPMSRLRMPNDDWPQSVAFSPDGKKAFAGTIGGNLWVWNLGALNTSKRITLTSGDLLTGSVDCLAVSPDGTRLLAGCADRCIRVVDVKSEKVTRVLKGHKDPVFSVAFFKDSAKCLSGCSGRATIILWDLRTGKMLRQFEGEKIVSSVAIAPDERTFLTTEFDVIQEWDLESGKRLRSFKGHEARINTVFYAPNGKIVSGGYDKICVWDARTGKLSKSIDDGISVCENFALSADGNSVMRGGLTEMHMFDVKAGIRVRTWKGLVGLIRVALSPDGLYVLSGDDHGLALWSIGKGK